MTIIKPHHYFSRNVRPVGDNHGSIGRRFLTVRTTVSILALVSLLMLSGCDILPVKTQEPATEQVIERSAQSHENTTDSSAISTQGGEPTPIETSPDKTSENVSTEKTAAVVMPAVDMKPDTDCPVVLTQKPATKPKPVSKPKNVPLKIFDDKLVIGRVENIYLLPDNIKIKAKIDTGAKTSSLNALNITKFERDGKNWVRFAMIHPETSKKMFFERPILKETKVKQLDSETQIRPTISMPIMLGKVEEQVVFTLSNREGYLYQVLIGRNFLRDHAIVDVSRTFVTQP